MMDEVFPPQHVEGGRLEVAASAFEPLAGLGFTSIGAAADPEEGVQVVGYASQAATVWVIFYRGALSVLVVKGRESDPRNFHKSLAAWRGKKSAPSWGSFTIQPQHLPAAARSFLTTAAFHLRGGDPDFEELAAELDKGASSVGEVVWTRAAWGEAQALARAGRHRAAVRALEYFEPQLTAEELQFLNEQRRAADAQPPLLDRENRSDQEWIALQADHLNSAHDRLRAAFAEREVSGEANARWIDAARDFRDASDFLYSALDESLARLRSGDRGAADYLLAFLEVDPWCFRSGYVKGRLFTAFSHDVQPAWRRRLAAALLRQVDAGYRREFRSACKLARAVAEPGLVDGLRDRLNHHSDV
ncbi:MAG TPA: hypothetical protein VF160_15340, partial [Candidatus Dormibacteraeota bacterium]